jgi:hypothetical protein
MEYKGYSYVNVIQGSVNEPYRFSHRVWISKEEFNQLPEIIDTVVKNPDYAKKSISGIPSHITIKKPKESVFRKIETNDLQWLDLDMARGTKTDINSLLQKSGNL